MTHVIPDSDNYYSPSSDYFEAPTAAQEAAQKAAQEAAQKAAQEAAQEAAQKAAQEAAQKAAQKAAQEAAQKAAQEAAQKAIKEAIATIDDQQKEVEKAAFEKRVEKRVTEQSIIEHMKEYQASAAFKSHVDSKVNSLIAKEEENLSPIQKRRKHRSEERSVEGREHVVNREENAKKQVLDSYEKTIRGLLKINPKALEEEQIKLFKSSAEFKDRVTQKSQDLKTEKVQAFKSSDEFKDKVQQKRSALIEQRLEEYKASDKFQDLVKKKITDLKADAQKDLSPLAKRKMNRDEWDASVKIHQNKTSKIGDPIKERAEKAEALVVEAYKKAIGADLDKDNSIEKLVMAEYAGSLAPKDLEDAAESALIAEFQQERKDQVRQKASAMNEEAQQKEAKAAANLEALDRNIATKKESLARAKEEAARTTLTKSEEAARGQLAQQMKAETKEIATAEKYLGAVRQVCEEFKSKTTNKTEIKLIDKVIDMSNAKGDPRETQKNVKQEISTLAEKTSFFSRLANAVKSLINKDEHKGQYKFMEIMDDKPLQDKVSNLKERIHSLKVEAEAQDLKKSGEEKPEEDKENTHPGPR